MSPVADALRVATWTLAEPHPGDAKQHVAAAIANFLLTYAPHHRAQAGLGLDLEELAAAVLRAAQETTDG